MTMQTSFDFVLALPEILLLIMAGTVLLLDAFSKSETRHATFLLSLASLVIITAVSVLQWTSGVSGSTFGGLFVVDSLAHFLKIVSYLAVIATLIYGRGYNEARDMMRNGGELYSLTLFALLGQMVMISAGNMLTVYLGLELMSLALYALVALRRDHLASTEAAMKYFVLG